MASVQESLNTNAKFLSIQQVADMFLYANLNDFPPPSGNEEKIWQGAIQALQSEQWEVALIQLEKLEKVKGLSHLQLTLLKVLNLYVNAASRINRGDDEL